jgi:hypothetical protein
MCGCDTQVPARFVPGHDGRLLRRLLQASRRGLPVVIYGVEYRADSYAAKVGPVYAGWFQELVAEERAR